MIHRENMHLTLAFIGDYDDPDLVRSVIDSIEIRPFDIRLSGVGAFRPRKTRNDIYRTLVMQVKNELQNTE
jgi:2'-5' RNA ligase